MRMLMLLAAALTFGQPRLHKVVIQVNVSGDFAFGNILDNASNLEKAFGTKNTQIEIVCHGPGIDMLLPHQTKLSNRVRRLQNDGVIFAACSNTLKGRHIDSKRLLPGAVVVDSGVAEVVRKEEEGWAYLKGG